jgi:hypothetical protein
MRAVNVARDPLIHLTSINEHSGEFDLTWQSNGVNGFGA